jgi:hypothetical protein
MIIVPTMKGADDSHTRRLEAPAVDWSNFDANATAIISWGSS